jgi:hypothetical protein
MRVITAYQADDGTKFFSDSACHAHEVMVTKCAAVEARLRPRPTSYHGDSYRQHPTGTRAWLTFELKVLGASRDSDGPLGRLITRLCCIDDQEREWGQPFFASNPNPNARHEV